MMLPRGSRILVRPDPQVLQTASGLFLPEQYAKKPRAGEVLAVGPGRIERSGGHEAAPAKVGDRIIFEDNAGIPFKDHGVDVRLIDFNEVIAFEAKTNSQGGLSLKS